MNRRTFLKAIGRFLERSEEAFQKRLQLVKIGEQGDYDVYERQSVIEGIDLAGNEEILIHK